MFRTTLHTILSCTVVLSLACWHPQEELKPTEKTSSAETPNADSASAQELQAVQAIMELRQQVGGPVIEWGTGEDDAYTNALLNAMRTSEQTNAADTRPRLDPPGVKPNGIASTNPSASCNSTELVMTTSLELEQNAIELERSGEIGAADAMRTAAKVLRDYYRSAK